MIFNSLLFILAISCNVVASAKELGKEELGIDSLPQLTIQHLPQDNLISIFSFVDYSTLGKSRRVCKDWKMLINDKLPVKQRYTLKLISQFPKGLKQFEEIFLTQLPDDLTGKTVLDDIIEELQEELGSNKEQACQALLDTKLVHLCPSIGIKIIHKKTITKILLFPYISSELFKLDLNHINKNIKLIIVRKTDEPIQIFGLKNLSIKLLSRVTEMMLIRINLSRVPKQIQRLSGLTHFSLVKSNLRSLPAGIGQLTNLTCLYLHDNQLNSIPAEIGQLTKLECLYLYNNQLNNIPAAIGQLTNLKTLTLHNNQLSNIPPEIGNLTNLSFLNLSNNQLRNIPPEVKQLKLELFLKNNPLNKKCVIS